MADSERGALPGWVRLLELTDKPFGHWCCKAGLVADPGPCPWHGHDTGQRDHLAEIYAKHFGEDVRDLSELDWQLFAAIQRAGYRNVDDSIALKQATDAAFDAIETAYQQRGDTPTYSYPDIELCVQAAISALKGEA